MRIGIIGVGNIGSNTARRMVLGGHDVVLAFSRNPDRLAALAAELGERATPGTPQDAAGCDIVVLSVPWGVIDEALGAAGSLEGRIVLDTTNQFGPGRALDLGGRTAAQVNAERIKGARYTKSFNTLTAAFQSAGAGRTGDDRVVQWLCGDGKPAKDVVAGVISDAGYVAVDLGGTADAAVMEAPRRRGAVYGEEYHLADALAVVAAVRAGRPIPPTPVY